MTYEPPRYDPRQHEQRVYGQPPQEPSDRSWAHGPQPAYPVPQAPAPAYYPPQQSHVAPRKRRRVFMWVFIAVQVLFVIWLITGIASSPASNSASAAAEAAKFCAGNGWSPLYTSHAQCLSQYGSTLRDAGDTGTALGAGIIVVLWCVVDFLMGITWLIIRLSRRAGTR